ncbi:diguanylate cyclase [Nocardioides albidus]|uniref:Diguanylate cyclase n=1 Tax=Nocardioides albidus TaxID=1517589 RepID=A0A5C4VT34_9ACTN|nr:diguanylate cyclase [Nocardioides albidus]TNM38635.1 diguanylate cyclase [Nocardioides albidus]
MSDALLYDHAPCGYLTTSADGVVSRANATLLGWLGRGYDALVGTQFADHLRAGARVVWLTHHIPRLAATGRLDAVAVDVVRADGSLLPAIVTAVLSPDPPPAGGRPEVLITLIDASERQAYERELLLARQAAERARWRMRALQRVTEACATAETEDVLAHGVAAAVAAGLELAVARVWLDRDGALTAAAADSVVDGDATWADEAPSMDSFRAWRDGIPVLPEQTAGTRTSAAVPLGHGGETLGVLEVVVAETWRGTPADLEVLVMMGAVIGQALARARMHARMERMALYDDLTDLPNRALFLRTVEQAVARSRRASTRLTLLFVDLDGFKGVNDTYGHAAGDQVLQECAGRIRGAVRAADLVARLGGDEFVVLCEDCSPEIAEEIAQRVRDGVREPIVLADGIAEVGASVGITTAVPPHDEGIVDRLIADGDAAMYAEKAGRQRL